MRVLVTGAAGRVGSTLAQQLVQSGHDVRGTVQPDGRQPHPALAARIEVVEAAMTDARALRRAVADTEVVVHLAARIVVGGRPADELLDVNVGGTLRLLEASVAGGSRVRRFVFASTDNVYGPATPASGPYTEESPQRPGDYYGTSKVLAEQLVRNHRELHGLEYTIMRLGSVIAPNEALPLFRLAWTRAFLAGQVEAGKRGSLWQLFAGRDDVLAGFDTAVSGHTDNPAVALLGPGGAPWSIHFTDVRDSVAGLMLGIERPQAADEVFNVVGPRTTTFAAGAGVVAAAFGIGSVDVTLPVRLAFEVSTVKARSLLGYAPQWDFAATLESALRTPHVDPSYLPVSPA
ncbi:NAD-dependent epimerase/dehydratase family protein [Jiangella alkaliphila]|uniref:Nucleoside-diphosphate-sugar epimerase n=1 Tax=Jiangella alkaliphila TaxID=419479 RepID=A0A1H2K4H5_9ACTN|nr:NAD(P)-dependent oxidoreductase [Jiangella alkaliphila]SDU63473.1 Nucleoside-diphosphate-sugar epimerase [Jiangella alkaliphila]